MFVTDGYRAAVRAAPAVVLACGGAAGATARWGIIESVGYGGGFGWSLLAVNTAGSLLLGVVIFAVAHNGRELLRLGLGVGFCGSFTTFSSFALVAAELGRDGNWATAAAFVALSVAASVLALIAGSATARLVVRRSTT